MTYGSLSRTPFCSRSSLLELWMDTASVTILADGGVEELFGSAASIFRITVGGPPQDVSMWPGSSYVRVLYRNI
jgi:hypothetical protein